MIRRLRLAVARAIANGIDAVSCDLHVRVFWIFLLGPLYRNIKGLSQRGSDSRQPRGARVFKLTKRCHCVNVYCCLSLFSSHLVSTLRYFVLFNNLTLTSAPRSTAWLKSRVISMLRAACQKATTTMSIASCSLRTPLQTYSPDGLKHCTNHTTIIVWSAWSPLQTRSELWQRKSTGIRQTWPLTDK